MQYSLVSLALSRSEIVDFTDKKLDACEIEQSRTSSVYLYTTKQMLINFHSWLIKIALECSQHFHQLCVLSEEKALSRLRFSSATKHM